MGKAVLIRAPYHNNIGQLIEVGDKVVVYALHGGSFSRRIGTYAGMYVRDVSPKNPYHKDLAGETYIHAVRVDGVETRRYNYTTRKSETAVRCGVYPRKEIYKLKQ